MGGYTHIDHLKGLLKLAKESGVQNVYVHGFMDGRDVPPSSGKEFIVEIENYMKEIELVKLLLSQEDTMQWIEITDGKE